jgi:hypothetical protein
LNEEDFVKVEFVVLVVVDVLDVLVLFVLLIFDFVLELGQWGE